MSGGERGRALCARCRARAAQAAFDRRIAVLGKHARMQVACASRCWCTGGDFGVTSRCPDVSKLVTQQPLEVTLVNTKSTARPQKADALAQANLDGGGNTDAQRRARSPLPVPNTATPATDLTMAQKRAQQLERDAKQLLTQAQSTAAIEVTPTAPAADDEQPGPHSASGSRSLEIARLEARISKDWAPTQRRAQVRRRAGPGIPLRALH